MDWFQYERDLRHERVNNKVKNICYLTNIIGNFLIKVFA